MTPPRGTSFAPRHLLGIEPLSAAEIETVLDLGERFLEIAARPIKKVPIRIDTRRLEPI